MDEKLILNNGMEIAGHYLETETRLFLYMFNITMTETFETLIVPENTEVIKMIQYGKESQISGYNHLCSISEERGGMICASLKKVTS